MIRRTELGIPNNELSLRDFEMVLPSLIPSGNTAVLTDFDETLCSSYEYDVSSKTHWPNIDEQILLETRRMQSPLFIATSRSSNEPVVQIACASLVAHGEFPIICENGSVLYFPKKESQEIILISNKHIEKINEIKKDIHNVKHFSLPENRELIINDNRIATIEMRIQRLDGKGEPSFYKQLMQALSENFDLSDLDLVSSGSSLSIQSKGVNKGTAFLQALSLLGLKRNDLFVIGLGDAPNDKEIFEQSDLRIGVRREAIPFSDIIVNEGDKATLVVMKAVK